jgi:hypothetical protein
VNGVTLEGVKALSDEELRSKAAECLGARWYRSVLGSVVGRYLYIVPESRPGVEIDSIPADGTEPLCGGAMKYIPDYPHDIAAAWGLAERIPAPFSIERGYETVWGQGPNGWWAEFGEWEYTSVDTSTRRARKQGGRRR